MAIRVDDRSSYITYSPGWERGGSQTDYEGSVSYATAPNQSAALTFQGIRVAVFGRRMPKSPGLLPPVTSYSIDGGPATTYEEVQDDIEHPNQQFYQSPVLSNGQHTIVVTNVLGGHTSYFLDYFQIVTADDTPSTTPTPASAPSQTPIVLTATVTLIVPPRSSSITSSHSASSSAINSSSSLSMTNGTSITVTPSSGSNPFSMPSSTIAPNGRPTRSNSGRHTGIILGSCLGVAVIAISVLVLHCWLRKRRQESRDVYDWRKFSGYSKQPHLSECYELQVGRLPSKFSQPHDRRSNGQVPPARDPLNFQMTGLIVPSITLPQVLPTEALPHDQFGPPPPAYSQIALSYNPTHLPSPQRLKPVGQF